MFMSDALTTYKDNIIELPADLDIDKPMLWQNFSQKRSKTGSLTEQPYFAEPRIPELYKSLPLQIQRPPQRYEVANTMNPNFQKPEREMDYNPAKDFPSYMKNSPHLNDLSRNLRSKHMNDFPVGFNPNFDKTDNSGHLNLKPLRAPSTRIGQISLPPLNESHLDLNNNKMKVEYGVHNRMPHYTSPQVTGSNEVKSEVPLIPNDQKPHHEKETQKIKPSAFQPQSCVYQNTRSSVKIKMEAVQNCDGCKSEPNSKPVEETLEAQIKRYESMLRAAEELKKLIDQRVKKED